MEEYVEEATASVNTTNEINVDALVAAIQSELDGILALKEEQKMAQRLPAVEKMFNFTPDWIWEEIS